MHAGSLENGTIDTEFTPQLTRVAPPLGDVVHAMEATIRRLEHTVATQAEEIHAIRQHQFALVARIHAVEQAIKDLEAAQK